MNKISLNDSVNYLHICRMSQHRGEIVEEIVRKSGYAIKALAQQLGFSRNTLYNRFREPNLNYEFIAKVGNIIHYDFVKKFPDMEKPESGELSPTYMDRKTAELLRVEKKYIKLLENYNQLFKILTRLANNNDVALLKQEIIRFIESIEE